MKQQEDKIIPIRPHHGMCLAYFKGKGYSEEFTRHMGDMLKTFEKNALVCLTVHTDEICSACPNNQEGICRDCSKVERYDREVLRACGFEEDTRISFGEFAKAVQEKIISLGNREIICGDCQWNDICRNQKSRWETDREK